MTSVIKIDGISVIPFDQNDRILMAYWAAMLSEHSWGWDFPVDPIDEICKAEFIVGAFVKDVVGVGHLVGAACINREANNDGKGNHDMWFSGWVVRPQFRGKGIGQALHDACIKYGIRQHGPIVASSETKYMDRFFLKNRWKIIEDRRTARNEAAQPMMLYMYRQSGL